METKELETKRYFGYTRKQLLSCVVCFIILILFGAICTASGVYFPLIKFYFKLEYDYQGLLVSIASIGYILFSLFVGVLTNTRGISFTMITGLTILILFFVIIILFPNVWVLLISLAIVGIGNVFLDVGANVWATMLFVSHKAIFMNLFHCCYGIGSVIGPLYSGFVSKSINLDYRGVFIGTVVLSIVGLLLVLVSPKNTAEQTKADVSDVNRTSSNFDAADEASMSIMDGLKNPHVVLMGLSLGCCVCVETLTTNWAPLYFHDMYGWDIEKKGAGFISSFFMLFTISRLISGFVIDLIGEATSAVIYSGLVLLTYIVGFLLGEKGIWVLIATGLFDGPLFPLFLTVNMEMMKKNAARVVSVELFINSIFGSIIQLVVGLINKHIGIQWGYRLAVVITFCMFIAMVYFKIMLNHRKNREEKDEFRDLIGGSEIV